MYEHHKESLRIMAEHYRRQPGVIALIFGGSVPKGLSGRIPTWTAWRLSRRRNLTAGWRPAQAPR